MKVLHVITGLGMGGAEAMLYKLLQHRNPSVSCHVFSLSDDGHYGSLMRGLGVEVESLRLNAGRPSPIAAWRLSRRIRALKPDVVQTWMYHADLLGGLAARLAGITAVAWGIMQSNLSGAVNKRSTLWVVRACAWLSRWVPARIVTVSEAARASHAAIGYRTERFVQMPVGFDLGEFKPDAVARQSLRTELGIPEHAPLIGHVGRFDPQKDHLGLIAAFAKAHRRRPDAHLVMAGSGVDAGNPALVDAISAAGLGASVHLLGRRASIAATMAAFDIFASSSIGEGFPNVLGEAMACAVPCVVTDVGDCRIVVGDTGRVVPPENSQALADALLELLAMDGRVIHELGRRARARVEQYYEIGAVTRRFELMYEGMMP